MLRDNTMSILFLELEQLFVAIIPVSPIPHLPNKSNFIQLGLPLLSHQTRFALHLRLPLPTLIRHPLAQLGIFRVQTRDADVAVLVLILQERIKVLLPERVPADVPLEVNSVQHGDAIGVEKDGGGLVLLIELVVLALRLDPVVQQAVARVVVRDVKIAALGLVEQKLIEHGIPALLTAAEVASEGGRRVGVQVQEAAAGRLRRAVAAVLLGEASQTEQAPPAAAYGGTIRTL
mmetsp:Transcript_17047/g.36025  ORF Transcript_17047/g.36025 Transcript_17047/m.36025 type:complete len:233 (-) Transcript_17047:347-1045(-)